MKREKALELLAEMNRCAVQVTHQCNSTRGLSKKAANEEYQAASAIFLGLTGEHMTREEWISISS